MRAGKISLPRSGGISGHDGETLRRRELTFVGRTEEHRERREWRSRDEGAGEVRSWFAVRALTAKPLKGSSCSPLWGRPSGIRGGGVGPIWAAQKRPCAGTSPWEPSAAPAATRIPGARQPRVFFSSWAGYLHPPCVPPVSQLWLMKAAHWRSRPQ